MLKSANDNVVLAPTEKVARIEQIIRRSLLGEQRAKAVLIWMLRQTNNLTTSVALTLCGSQIGIEFAESCTDAVQSLINEQGSLQLNRKMRWLTEVKLQFTSINGYGYRRGLLGSYLYYEDGTDEGSLDFPCTIWLSKHPLGRLPIFKEEREPLKILESTAWVDSLNGTGQN